MPILAKVRAQAQGLLSARNIKETINSVTLYAMDNDNRFPKSVAITDSTTGTWSDPRRILGSFESTYSYHRSLSAYLKPYIKDADSLFCPNARKKHTYWQEAWDAGDDFDIPNHRSSLIGTYCFYWNYHGCITDCGCKFKGPRNLTGGRGQSKMLMCCFLGYDNALSSGDDQWGSCNKFKGASIKPETWTVSSYWCKSSPEEYDNKNKPDISLRAGFIDGHAETFSADNTIPMQVMNARSNEAFGPLGTFYIPKSATHR